MGPAGWSKERIDLSALKTADLDLTLQLAGLVLKGVEAGATTLTLKLTDGRLNAGLADTALFGGTLGGKLTLDASGTLFDFDYDRRLIGVRLDDALLGIGGFFFIEGTFVFEKSDNMALDVQTQLPSRPAAQPPSRPSIC